MSVFELLILSALSGIAASNYSEPSELMSKAWTLAQISFVFLALIAFFQ